MKIILLLIVVFSGIVYSDEPILYADLYLYQNDTVVINAFTVDYGEPQLYADKGAGEYEARIIDSNGNLIWQKRKSIYFYPENRDIRLNISMIPYEKVNVVSRIPYTSEMKEYQLTHNDRVIFSQSITPCNRNEKCENELGEDSSTCQDCPSALPESEEKINLIYAMIPIAVITIFLTYKFFQKRSESRILKEMEKRKKRANRNI